MEYIDENTIGVYVILGSMLTISSGEFPAYRMNRHLHWPLRASERDG
jgi:hypothetical protein